MRILLASMTAAAGLVLLLPLLVVLVPLLAVALCTRGLARILEPKHLRRDQLIEFDPVFGWKPRANLATYHLSVDVFRISTDEQGWRGRTTLSEADIVVFGDSFAAGYGVSDDELFANLSVRPRIKPIGIGGYSMVQEAMWMDRLASSLAGKLVVWFIYLGNDLYDNLTPELHGYRKPFVHSIPGTTEWQIRSDHISRERWTIPIRSRKGHIHMGTLAELCSDTFLAQRAYSACEYLIRRGRETCSRAGADLAVISIPDPHQLHSAGHDYLRSLRPTVKQFDPDLPDARIASICESLGVRFIAGRTFLDLSCYKHNDCHWNPAGHRRVARVLTELYGQRRSTRADRGIELAAALPADGALARSTFN